MPTHSNKRPAHTGLACLLAALAGFAACAPACAAPAARPAAAAAARPAVPASVPPAAIGARFPALADLIERAVPAVVSISVTEKPSKASDELAALFKTNGSKTAPQRKSEVRGTGFLISDDGYVLTASMNVETAESVTVMLSAGASLPARVVGFDDMAKLALLKIDGKNLPFLRPGDSGTLRAGDWVVAIGSQFKLHSSATAGIVSFVGRETGEFLPLIQSDVRINLGSGGGPLLNLSGEVVGVNYSIATRTGGFESLSFALPINEVMQVADQLKASGKVTRGFIGVSLDDQGDALDPARADGAKAGPGAVVGRVDGGGPAEQGGVLPGDAVLAVDGRPIASAPQLARMVAAVAPGTRITLRVRRGRDEFDLGVVAGAVPVKRSPVVGK